ncbi:Core-2/I-Branching enzyme [Formivibrio citricus]|uniref:Peptide O-xylosyltransferase n=1 Tax=Formivibrio citricus TaxID=83765 RepID=A0A1I4YAS5_9NEIS|nr:beta-1,6-N-acetylglucosaminyltransferase [Formivibrio citricus]SFN34700.1 Core-2/I-Branching enzyme [Formivibrio citricus]
MKIAYLILAHAHPQQVGRLTERLSAPGVHVYIHVDANTPATTFSALQAEVARCPAPVSWVERQPCRWGGFSLVEATLRLMRAALADRCDWLILLSGQDYPLQPNAAIAKKLENSDRAGFIDLQEPGAFDVRYRHEAWHFETLNGKPLGKLLQKAQRGLNRIGLRRPLPEPLTEIRAGSQWWMLSSQASHWLLDFCDKHPRIIPFFYRTLVPDEMFFQTLLWHSPLREQLCPDPLRLIEWEPGSWSPRTFTEADLPQLLATPALFARKFAPDGRVAALLDAARDEPECSHS